MSEPTRAEICAVAIAETFRGDGEILASPIGMLPQIGVKLAKLSFEPDLLMTDGVAFLRADVAPVGAIEQVSALVDLIDVAHRFELRRLQSAAVSRFGALARTPADLVAALAAARTYELPVPQGGGRQREKVVEFI